MKRKEWIVKYLLDFVIIVLGITVSFWVNQLSINAQNYKERVKVLNSLQEEADEIYAYCKERKENWNQDLLILNSLLDEKSKAIESENINKSRIQFKLIYYRVFEPPTDRYHSIINSGQLKYLHSEKIKELISKQVSPFLLFDIPCLCTHQTYRSQIAKRHARIFDAG